MLHTRITEDYGIDLPFVGAGMGFVATTALTAAVSRAGGLGMLGGSAMPAPLLREALEDLHARAGGPFGVNFIPQFTDPALIEVCAEQRVPVVSFFWEPPALEWLERLRAAGARIWIQIGAVEEAREAAALGVDALVVQGSEAGGHNRSTAGTFALVPAVVDAVAPLPVIAAGGIADGRGVAAALALGAEAVWVGTRLVASEEAHAHPEYKQRLVAAGVGDTARTFVFGTEFPDASTRGLRNRVIREFEGRDTPPPYHGVDPAALPVVGRTRVFGEELTMTRFTGFPPMPETEGDFEEMNLLAGESVGQIHGLRAAADIVRTMMAEAREIIDARLAPMARDR